MAWQSYIQACWEQGKTCGSSNYDENFVKLKVVHIVAISELAFCKIY